MLDAGSHFGYFQIETLLGSGGMGQVYRALDTRLDRVVALKLINEELSKSEQYRASLADEARKAAKIDSPHVVRVWEYSIHNEQPYIAMEYVAGEDLRSRTPSLQLPEKTEIAVQTATGIGAAHKAGLVHRDLKPENILLNEASKVKILDFGLAKLVQADNVNDFGEVEGTIYYLSPEQIAAEVVSFPSDLFSFGTILYEMYTGVRPFEAEFSAMVVYSILHEDPEPPSVKMPDLPSWIDPLVMKLLQKDAANRFQSVDEVLQFITESQLGATSQVEAEYVAPKKKVTVIDLKNMSGDPSWDYFCQGFSEDVIREISRRTDLIVFAEPTTSHTRDIRDVFRRCRSDFVITGSLLKWQDTIKLQLSLYGEQGEKLISGESYQGSGADLFQLLSQAATGISIVLAETTGQARVEVSDAVQSDVTAYDCYLKGKSYYQTNKAEDLEFAARLYNKALELQPGYALAHAGLSDVYAFQYMAYYDRTPERILEAKQQAELALKADPILPEAHRSLGRYHMFTGNFAEAESCFLTAVRFNPKYAIGYRTLAWLKRSSGEYTVALDWVKRALELMPTDLETLLLLGLLYLDQQSYTAAMATFQRATELGPDYGRAYYNLGQVYLKLGVLDLSLENLLLAMKYKGDPNCYIDAGFILMVQKNGKAARSRFEESIKEKYLTFAAHYYWGMLEIQEQQPEEARKQFQRVLDLTSAVEDPEFADPHPIAFRALAFARLGQMDAVRSLMERLIPNAPQNGEIMYALARCHALLGDLEQARATLEQAYVSHAGPSRKEAAIDPHFAELLSK